MSLVDNRHCQAEAQRQTAFKRRCTLSQSINSTAILISCACPCPRAYASIRNRIHCHVSGRRAIERAPLGPQGDFGHFTGVKGHSDSDTVTVEFNVGCGCMVQYGTGMEYICIQV